MKRILLGVAAGLAAVLLIGTPANAAPIQVRAGDTYSGLVQRHCAPGTSWQSLDFGGRNKNLIYAGETIDIRCTATAAPRAAVTSGWVAPVNACVGSGFGWRASTNSYHYGVDLRVGYGVPIHAIHSGTVSVKYNGGNAGNYTVINHGGGQVSVYMHQSRFAVTSGWVSTGQVIGYVGATGNATRYVNGVLRSFPHVHFETHTGGPWNGKVNPVGFMAARGVTLRWC